MNMVAEATPTPRTAASVVSSRQGVWLFAISVALLLGNCYHYFPFLSDDSLISLRYSQRLLEGRGLTWSSGPPVEGYTNLLWVLGVALLGRFGLDLILACRLLGVLCSFLTAIFILRLPVAGSERARDLGKLSALLMFAMSATTAVWAIGGLEQPMVGACLAGGLLGAISLTRSERPNYQVATGTGVSLALMCLTRPDSPIFVAAIGGALALGSWIESRRVDWRSVGVVVGIPLATYLGHSLFRHFYYGDWVPNTAHVKLRPSADHFAGGLRYLYLGFVAGAPLYLAALASVIDMARRRMTTVVLLLAVPAALWVGYLAVIGGDIFPSFRHFTPLVVLSVFAVALGFGQLLERIPWRLGAAPIALAAGSLWCVQFLSLDVRRAETENFEWEGRDFALALKSAFGAQKPLLAVTAAGCLPYWSGFDSIDMLGLNDAYIPRHPPKSFGSGLIGHELGNADYVFRRRPDMIIYNVGTLHDSFLTGKELEQKPEFLRAYTPVSVGVQAGGLADHVVWIDRYSKKIGYQRSADRLVVPGYLANGFNYTRAVESDDRQHLDADVEPKFPARLVVRVADLPLAPFDVKVVGSGQLVTQYQRLADGSLDVRVSSGDGKQGRMRQVEIDHR